jgi:hypothetical protein
MMRYENWLSSKEKWEKIVEALRAKRVNWQSVNTLTDLDCGYCSEYNMACSFCPLKHKLLCWDPAVDGNRKAVFWQLHDMVLYGKKRNKRKALNLAKKILEFIINDEPKEK